MQVLPNGDYKLPDGRIIPKKDIAELHRKAPLAPPARESVERKKALELQEGQSSGPISLND